MTTVHIDPKLPESRLRSLIYQGDLVVFTTLSSVNMFVQFVRKQLQEVFAPHDPRDAHEHYSPEELARILGVWKPRFIHHLRAKQLVREVIEEAGCSPDHSMFDLPKPRTSYPAGHLTTGIAFAFPWHRDTWYAAPPQQINWWFPVSEVSADNAMEFDPVSFARPVANDSAGFDYYQVNAARLTTAKQVGKEAQSRPGARMHQPPDSLIVLPPPGSILLFSGAQLHASITNQSGVARYSVDFRTIDRRDVENGIGAPMADVACTGTALRDFVSVRNGTRLDEALVRKVEGRAPPEDAILVFDDKRAEEAARLSGGGA
jgi:hypothetical protein